MFKNENDILRIFFSGRIDSSTVKNAEEEYEKAVSGSEYSRIILDIKHLEYISSAGLRLILKIKKENKDTEIVNASSDVYDIFEMTGFTEMLPIKKTLREISIDGAAKIGEGAVGKIYKITDDTIVKLFKSGNLADIERERNLAKKAFILGIPTYISFDTVIVNGKYASVFELVNAAALSTFYKTDWEHRNIYNQKTVELMKKIHSVESDDEIFNKAAENYKNYIKTTELFTAEEKNNILAIINSIPETNGLIHGDFHFNNIMIHDDEITVIDMDSIAAGSPVYEHAALFCAYVGFSEVDRDNALSFHGMEPEKLEEIFFGIFNGYYADKSETERAELLKVIKMLGYLLVVIYTENDDNKKITFNHCMNKVKELSAN